MSISKFYFIVIVRENILIFYDWMLINVDRYKPLFYNDKNQKRERIQMLNLNEVASRLNMHYNTIYKYIKSGELKAVKFKRVYRIEEKELQKFIKDRQVIVK
ncbi:MAG TPA: helix-turn-helix domain-containing protein [Candidatus Paceibacterota bacterium]|nr:helix-turn-helix domain-containing protein [Candidatus Paceibacterota bacterium]